MIVNIRGTSGSGKSHLVRTVMARYDTHVEMREDGRKWPVGHLCHAEGRRSLMAIGSYAEGTPCGGCDTFSKKGALDDVYRRVREAHALGMDVIYEGLIVMSDRRRACELYHDTHALTVITIDIPLQECLAAVAARRAARGDDRPLDPTNTASRLPAMERSHRIFREQGVPSCKLNREQALTKTLEALGWATPN